ncbi:SRPBCC family protein [Sphingopyxis sp. Root1497]|uniref:SRPBCC family protein n=1 Tax=Sphingopyxis sp. Root1497 TaxID=1736474 RepID=UPI0009EAE3AC|nr:SRPBCC family protein [Sphingopyxis sp. Root1497]
MSSFTDRLVDRFSGRKAPDPFTLAAAGAGLAAAGIALAFWRRSQNRNVDDGESITTDAPHWTLDKPSKRALFGKSVLINRTRKDLFAAWKVERFPAFMENVVAVEQLGDGVSQWTVKAPADREVTLVNRITETIAGKAISWQSEPQSDIANSGEVRFTDAPAGRGTYVSLILAYDPPGGKLGRLAAKLLQREPEEQARRDLYRFKQLMETGEVTSNASPSARASESVTQPHI